MVESLSQKTKINRKGVGHPMRVRVHLCLKKFSPSTQNKCCSSQCPHATDQRVWKSGYTSLEMTKKKKSFRTKSIRMSLMIKKSDQNMSMLNMKLQQGAALLSMKQEVGTKLLALLKGTFEAHYLSQYLIYL